MTDASLPAPLTPEDCDLQAFDWFPFHHKRLRQSAFWKRASDAACRVSVELWAEAFAQVPAGSLPDDDVQLSDWTGFGRRDVSAWLAVKDEVMSAWVKCSDGRWYHPELCEVACEAWAQRQVHLAKQTSARARKAAYRERAEAEDEAKDGDGDRDRDGDRDAPSHDCPAGHDDLSHGTDADVPRDDALKETGRGTGTETGTHTPPERPAAGSLDPNGLAWSRGVGLLVAAGRMSEARARTFFGKLLRGPPSLEARELLAAIAAAEANSTGDPQAYLAKAARAIAERRGPARGPITAEWDEATWRIACRNFRSEGAWSADMGPEPGRPGCLAPEGVLAEFGWVA